ncbi:MAG TPA: NADH-quinone oxidoreductase subunit K [Alphaproteobacteria bacterium]|nr:NADH-quinone oxidoreductase subunit K [Alphaproteobacteria bacterium]
MAKVIFGLAILTNATNLLIFTVAGPVRARPPIVAVDAEQLTPPFADPVPQAFILTAIVIGFGVLAFTLVLPYRAFQAVGSDDLDAMISTDTLPPDSPIPPEHTAPPDHAQAPGADQEPAVVREGTADDSG